MKRQETQLKKWAKDMKRHFASHTNILLACEKTINIIMHQAKAKSKPQCDTTPHPLGQLCSKTVNNCIGRGCGEVGIFIHG